MSPQAKRNVVQHLMAERDYSERGACQLVGISRSSARYTPKPKPEEDVFRDQVLKLAQQHTNYGYRRITAIIRREGSDVNYKRVQPPCHVKGLSWSQRT